MTAVKVMDDHRNDSALPNVNRHKALCRPVSPAYRKQTKRRGFKTMRDAKKFAATVEVEKLTGTYVAPKLGMITVGERAPKLLSRKESDVAASNYRTFESLERSLDDLVFGDGAYLPRPKSDGG